MIKNPYFDLSKVKVEIAFVRKASQRIFMETRRVNQDLSHQFVTN